MGGRGSTTKGGVGAFAGAGGNRLRNKLLPDWRIWTVRLEIVLRRAEQAESRNATNCRS